MPPATAPRENRLLGTELKFLVTPALARQIADWARTRLAADPYAVDASADGYQITSLYFDTNQFDVFHRRGSFGRSKYRIRRYGDNGGAGAYLERKLKTRGMLTKRRSFVSLEDLERLTASDPVRDWSGRWFRRRLLARMLKPVCQITYHRTARVGATDWGPCRLTLDENIRALRVDRAAFRESVDATPISQDQVILEMKFCLQMPVLFKRVVEEFALNPVRISKYRLAASALGLVAKVDGENLARANPQSLYA